MLCLLAIGVYFYTQRHPIHLVFTASHCRLVYWWFLLVAVSAAYGLVRGNDLVIIGKEFTAFCYIGFFLILGGDDRFWGHIRKSLTILFYAGALLVVAFSNTPMVQVAGDEVTQNLSAGVSAAHRNILSLGYGLRPLIASGLLLGVWGVAGKQKGLWRNLQVFAPFVLFACEVGLFLFRSAGIYILVAGISCLVLRPFLEGKPQAGKSILILAAAAVSVAIFAATETSGYFQARLSGETQAEGLFESRNAELREYLDEAGWSVLLGRGMGGSFDASSVYLRSWENASMVEAISKWGTLHYGVLVFALKGGIVMLAVFVGIAIPGFRRRRPDWYRNPYNLTAALLFPSAIVMVLTDPLFLSVEGLLFMLSLMVPLSRFGRRASQVSSRFPVYASSTERRLS